MITIMFAAALSQVTLAAPQSAPSVDSGTCIGALCGRAALRPFLRKLAGARRAREPVRIIWIGDSHTAADQVTGSWRALLQARFGDAGRGVLAPGRPYPGYLTRQVTVTQTGSWTVDAIFGGSYRAESLVPRGVAQFSYTAATPSASFGLTTDDGATFDQLQICAMRGPTAGALQLTLGTTSDQWDLAGDRVEPDCRSIEATAAASTASVQVTRGPVTVTSWATGRRARGGVVLSNLGTVGAQFVHLSRTDDAVVARELREYSPDLIVIAYGTNEAFKPNFSAAEFEASLTASLRRIRRLAPDVPILLIDAPDSATRLPALMSNAAPTSLPCPAAVGDAAAWRPTAALVQVQAVQRRVALATGVAYWDWSARMGGRCTAVDWSAQVPPLMRGDHVHFTTAGAARIAGWLDADMIAAMQAETSDGGERR